VPLVQDVVGEHRTYRHVDAGTDGLVHLGARLADPAAMAAWFDLEVAWAGGHRDLGGALIAYRSASMLAELTTLLWFERGEAIALDPDAMWIELVDGILVGDVAVEPRATSTDLGVAATTLVDTFGPLATEVRRLAPFGTAGMWGTLADHVAGAATGWGRRHGREVWPTVDRLLAALPARVRPRRVDVTADGRVGSYAAKGTCCLLYKAFPDALCSACPLRSPDDRRARFEADLRGSAHGHRRP
jgi:hypothetical protein